MARTAQVGFQNKRQKTSHKSQGKMKLAAQVKSIMGKVAESKEVVTSLSTTLNNSTAATQIVGLISGVAEGTDYNNRIGRSYTHKYVEVSICINSQAGAAVLQTGDAGFWSIILDRQPNGALPLFADMYETTILNNGGTAVRNTRLYQDRFLTVCHEDYACGTGNTAAGAGLSSGSVPYRIKKFVDLSKLKGRDGKAKCNGATAAIADLNEGALYFVFTSTLATAVQTTVLTGQCKYRFTDM